MSLFLIIGAGEAGVAAAGALRSSGFQDHILLVSEENRPPYARPPLSKATLTDEACAAAPIRTPAWIAARKIDLRLGTRVLEINPSEQQAVVESGGQRELIPYDRLLLGTGGRVRRLPMLAMLGERATYLRTYDQAIHLRNRLATAQSVAVIGGGVIGLEVASSARKLGRKVIVVEPAERLMARSLSPCTSLDLLRMHQEGGVDIRLQTGVVSAQATLGGAQLQLTDGTVVEVDTVVVGVGVEPNDDLARQMGCEVGNGIIVDEIGATSVRNVFAAGDVAAFPHPLFNSRIRVEAWQHASKHGAHVARAMLGETAPYMEVPWFWTDQLGANIQVAGLPTLADSHVRRGDRTVLHLQRGRLVGATTVNNAQEMRPIIKLIAAKWQGDSASLANVSRPLASFIEDHTRRPVATESIFTIGP